MAILPMNKYPGQIIITDPAYPFGKAKNVVVAGDASGTPFEKEWLNDLWGFLQSLLTEATVTPSDVPDKVGASQYLDALKLIIGAEVDPGIAAAVARIETLEARVAGGRVLPAVNHLIDDTAGFGIQVQPGGSVSLKNSGHEWYIDISPFLSQGNTITAISAYLEPGAARSAGSRCKVQLVRMTAAMAVSTLGAVATDNGTTAGQSVSVAGLSQVVDLATYAYLVRVTSGADAATNNDNLFTASFAIA